MMFPIFLTLIGLLACCWQLQVNAFVFDASPTSRVGTFLGASKKGYSLAKSSLLNKGFSFTDAEKKEKGLLGLFPAGEPLSLSTKVTIAMVQFNKKATPIEKYIFLHTIQDSDETLFYAILTSHTAETMPYVYTPTVGQACQEWSDIYRHTPRGIYLSLKDIGRVKEVLSNHPNKKIKAIVFTDGERILGLGDQGVNGMGIPIGKLALYTTCAGIDPSQCLPVHIDVGTNRKELRESLSYMGLRQERDRSPKYDALIKEFFEASQELYGRNVLMQFEDFGNLNAFRLLEEYRGKANCFNDDIQGTASVVLAGLISSLPLAKKANLGEHRYLFYGAGEAGIGIGELVSSAISQQTGISIEEARKRCFFVDSKGLITNKRLGKAGFEHHKVPYAHSLSVVGHKDDAATGSGLLDAVKLIKPTVIIGVSAQGGSFTEAVCKDMLNYSATPLIFALSNPTSQAECSAKDAYTWTDGKCVFCSGSPFDPVTLPDGRRFVPGQGNNAYIFPGVGLGAIASGATTLTDQDFYIAAAALAKQVPAERLAQGCAYPALSEIREVSAHIAAAVAKNVFDTGRSSLKKQPEETKTSEGLVKFCKDKMYTPKY